MRADGKAIIIITHKLHEVLAVSDRVAVLRKGEYIGDVPTANASQQSLTDMMVGRAVSLNIDLPEANAWQLERAGVPPQNITFSGICCHTDYAHYFSARRLGIHSGRIFTGIMLKEE
jgi:ABC-type uncharacterized transport system ATPase subunit